MRLLNIKTGFLETINISECKYKYIAISHRWLYDEINLEKIGLIGISENVYIGTKLLEDVKKKIELYKYTKIVLENYIKNSKYTDWIIYKKLGSIIKDRNIIKNINNHYKLYKIINCIEDIYDYIWIDTLCIDKTSSAELNENIISMYNIYEKARKVHAHLCNDYSVGDIVNILKDEWFSRNWTLQEYLANWNLIFYDNIANFICCKEDIWTYTNSIYHSDNLNIPSYLFKKYDGYTKPIFIPAGMILNWSFGRKSTKPEDKAYSLMGLLKTYISPLYGEGIENAMLRLLKEYMIFNSDTSIFDFMSPLYLSVNSINFINLPNFNYYNAYIHQNISSMEIITSNEFNFTNIGTKFHANIKKLDLLYNCIDNNNYNENIIIKWFKKKKLWKNSIEKTINTLYEGNLFFANINNNGINGILIYNSKVNLCEINSYLYIIIYEINNKILAYKSINSNIYIRLGKFIDEYDLDDSNSKYKYYENYNHKYNIEKIYNTNIKTIYISGLKPEVESDNKSYDLNLIYD